MSIDPEDQIWMARCLELAKKAAGRTSPNPLVGSVIIKNGTPIGEGFHPQAGQPHAEIFALQSAKNTAQDTNGTTLYVNLEPCNHYGRTPPCTEAIINAGIHRVVIGMIDPDPRVSGKGIERLRAAGITVSVGILEADCRKLNEAFSHRLQHQYPFGILKYAMTLDGKIATTTGHSYWITELPARQAVHYLRSTCDAVITGGNTVRHDNPHLNTHKLTDHSPLRVIMSRSLDLPPEAHLWQTDVYATIVVTLPTSSPSQKAYLLSKGVEIWEMTDPTPRSVMTELGRRGCNQVLWECGGKLAASALQAGMVQKIYAFIAPKIIGGENAPGPIGDLNLTQMTASRSLKNINIEVIGKDILITGYLD